MMAMILLDNMSKRGLQGKGKSGVEYRRLMVAMMILMQHRSAPFVFQLVEITVSNLAL